MCITELSDIDRNQIERDVVRAEASLSPTLTISTDRARSLFDGYRQCADEKYYQDEIRNLEGQLETRLDEIAKLESSVAELDAKVKKLETIPADETK